MLHTDWEKYQTSEFEKCNERNFKSLLSKDGEQGDDESYEDQWAETNLNDVPVDEKCKFVAVQDVMKNDRNKRYGFGCQVCSYEGRGSGRVQNVVVCMKHKLRLCTKGHADQPVTDINGKEIHDYSWRAPSDEASSCWDKAHKFYFSRRRSFLYHIDAKGCKAKVPVLCDHIGTLHKKKGWPSVGMEANGEEGNVRRSAKYNVCKERVKSAAKMTVRTMVIIPMVVTRPIPITTQYKTAKTVPFCELCAEKYTP